MGWTNERHGGEHEGWTVALQRVPQESRDHRDARLHDDKRGLCHNDYFRELAYPYDDDKAGTRIDAIQAGCDCGWRSERRRVYVPSEAKWSPFIALLSERLEEWIYERWREHIATLDAREHIQAPAVVRG